MFHRPDRLILTSKFNRFQVYITAKSQYAVYNIHFTNFDMYLHKYMTLIARIANLQCTRLVWKVSDQNVKMAALFNKTGNVTAHFFKGPHQNFSYFEHLNDSVWVFCENGIIEYGAIIKLFFKENTQIMTNSL